MSGSGWEQAPGQQPGRGLPYDSRYSLDNVFGRRVDYTYLASDLFTNRAISDLPLTGVKFNWAINEPGKFSANLNISSIAPKHEYFDATMPGKTVIYVIREGVPIWGGVIWKRNFDSEKREMRIEAETWDSYMRKRLITSTIEIQYEPENQINPRTKFGMEQVEIFRQLWKFMSQADQGDIKVILSDYKSPIYRGFHAAGSEYSTYMASILKELITDKVDSFEWYATVRLAPNGKDIERRIEFAYPHFGRTYEETGLVWEYPGNVLKYTWAADALDSDTVVYVTGVGDGPNQTVRARKNLEAMNDGYPRMDRRMPHPKISDPEVLISHAAKYLYKYSPPMNEITVEPHPSVPQHLGQFFLGDQIRFIIKDDLFNYARVENRDLIGKITSMEVTPNDEGLEQIRPLFTLASRFLEIVDPDDASGEFVPTTGWNGPVIDPPDIMPQAPDEPEPIVKSSSVPTFPMDPPFQHRTDRGLTGLHNSLYYGDDPWGGAVR